MTVRRHRLQNGLTVLTQQMDAVPVVALQAWVHAGSADEDPAEAGIAHLHEHMLFKGTPTYGVGEIAAAVEASGGEINAWTSFDQTVFHLVLQAGEMATGVNLLADALRNSAFDAGELAREIEVVLEEIRRADDSPSRRISKALFDLTYTTHPYRRPVLGSEGTVRALSRDRVLGFFARRYRPDNVTFIAVGDFDTDTLVAQVDAAFGDWAQAAEIHPVDRPDEPAQTQSRSRLLVEDVPESRCAIAWHIPGARHDDIAALDALAVILGYGDSSRLSREVRWRRELVNDIYTLAYTPREPGILMVGAGLESGTILAALALIYDEIWRTRRELVSDDELEKARVILLSEAAYQKETVQGEARKLGFYEVVAGDYAYEETYYDRLRALTPADIRRVAQTYLNGAPSCVLQTGTATDGDGVALADLLPSLAAERFARAEAPRRRPAAGEIGVVRAELDNGAILLLRSEPSSVVAMRAVALGGQRSESRDEAGCGNLFAALWGDATTELPPDAFARRVALLGGSMSAFSGRNALGLRGEFVSDKADDGLRLFCDALLAPRMEATALERERSALIQRIQNRADQGAGVAFDAFVAALFPHHPYGQRITGTVETVTDFTLAQISTHGLRLAAPDRLVVAVVGGIDSGFAIDHLDERLSGAATADFECDVHEDPPPRAALRERLTLDKKQSHILVGGMGTTIDNRDRYVLEVMTTVLSGQGGRLFLDLRDRRSLAYSVSCSSLEGIEPGHVLVHMGTSPDKVDAALDGIYEHLDRLRQTLAAAEEIARAKRYLVGTNAIDLQRCGARAMVMALAERFGLGYANYVHYAAEVESVTAAQIQRAAQQYLAPERLIEVVVGPE